jgi:PAS domain S-box-containing protein
MRSVVNHVVDGIITIDERGNIESYNPAAQKLFGYERGEVIGRNVKMLMPEPYHSEHDGYISNYVGSGHAKIIGIGREVIGKRKDGNVFPMELAVSEFHIRQRRYFTGIVRDITERKRLQDELQQRVHDLADADRQKNEFLAMLSHELRNPIAPMRNALYLIKAMGGATSADMAELQQMMERQMQQLVRLVDDLLDVSRIIRGKIDLRKERIDLLQAVLRASETAKPVIDANGHVLDLSLPEGPLWMMGDMVRLAQIIANLITNAAKYTHRPSRIELEVRREGAEACIAVRDQGEGIAQELLPRIFDLFVQGDHALARSQGGLGIGLTLVKRLVEMHEGTVQVRSEGKGRGSEFFIRLPTFVEAAVTPRGERAAALASGPSRRQLLKLFGHEVRCVYDGPSALAAAKDYRPEVVVLDIGLPEMDGYEVAKRMRASSQLQNTRIVAVTGYGQDEDRRRSRDAGFDQHLTKPVDPDVLQSLVAESL